MSILGIIFGQTRAKIGAITIDASISEDHVSTCEVTDNPVEDGSTIADHVQMKPKTLSIDGIISDFPITFPIWQNINNIGQTVAEFFGKDSRSIDAYQKLVKLQESREPFSVITGLRKYDNMILESLSIPRTSKLGGSILFSAKMKQVNIAYSQTGSGSFYSSSVKSIAGKTNELGKIKPKDAIDTSKSDLSPSGILKTYGERSERLFKQLGE